MSGIDWRRALAAAALGSRSAAALAIRPAAPAPTEGHVAAALAVIAVAAVLAVSSAAAAPAAPSAGTAPAAPSAGPQAAPAPPAPARTVPGLPRDLTRESLQKAAAAVEARRDIVADVKAKIAGLYRDALADLDAAAKARDEAADFRRRLAEAPTEVRRLERTLEEMQKADRAPASPSTGPSASPSAGPSTSPSASPSASPPGSATAAPPPDAPLSSEDAARAETVARSGLETARQELDAAERARDELSGRPYTLRQEQEKARAELDTLRAEVADGGSGERASALAVATRARARTRIVAVEAALERMEAESAYLPALERTLQLRRDIARLEVQRTETAFRQAASILEQQRRQEAAVARLDAILAGQEASSAPPVVRELVSENARLNAQSADVTVALDRALLELSRIRTRIAEIEEQRRTWRREAEAKMLGSDFAQRQIERLQRLPTTATSAEARAAREALVSGVGATTSRIEAMVAQLADLDSAVATELARAGAPVSADEREKLAPLVREQLVARRALVDRLQDQQQSLQRTVTEIERAEVDLVEQSNAARQELVRLLFGVPVSSIGVRTFENLPAAVAWATDSASWRATGAALVAEISREPLRAALVGAFALLLIAARPRSKRLLGDLAPVALSVEHYRVVHTLAALALTLVLAMPGALLLWYLGRLLGYARNADPFVHAVGRGLVSVGFTSFVLYGFSWLFDRRGVAVRHFQWSAEAMAWTKRSIRAFLWLYAPLVFLTTLSLFSQQAHRESLGRLAFIAMTVSLALFALRLFRRSSPLMQWLLRPEQPSFASRTHAFWQLVPVGVPLALALLAAIGYFFAAAALYQVLGLTVLVVLVALMVYGLVAMWVLVQRARLSRRQVAATAAAETGEVAADASALDISRLGAQTRQLLDLAATLALFGMLWWIWHDAIPVFTMINDVTLWRYVDLVDGEQVTRAVTLHSMVLAVAITVLAVVAVRNIGAVLDIVLLQRLELRSDATYAIKTVVRYALTGVAILVITSLLGFSWNKVQWLVAALGVGLGFGLQEIVANFVSGLIVLAERPIRIGDVVTVGDVTGKVTRIRARATVVADWEGKEIFIPNKAFITDRVTNWTLSSPMSRLLLKVGVAYGTDPDRVQALLLDAVRAHPDVMEDPAPSVFFVGLGPSSLDFEVRAFVDALDKRLPVTHALNAEIARVLAANGIEIPFPQQDVHIRTPALEAHRLIEGVVGKRAA